MAFPAGAFVYEFLYRGRAADDPTPPAYHVIVGVPGKDVFGNPTLALSQAMTPDQAVAQALPLPELIAGINASLTAQVATLQAQVASVEERLVAALDPAPTG